MNGPIVVLHSPSEHFATANATAGAYLIGAHVIALVPPGRPDLEAMLPAGTTAEVLAMPARSGRIRQGLATLRALRRLRPAMLCVLYPSPALRVVAALSGARERYWCGEDGRLRPLNGHIVSVLAGLAWQRIRGEWRYAWRWCVVHGTRVPTDRNGGTRE